MIIETTDGFKLDADLQEVDGSRKLVVFIHGLTGEKNSEPMLAAAAARLNSAGISTLRFSLRAHGQSSGDSTKDFTISGGLSDIEAVMTVAHEHGYQWIGITGRSFGAGLAALYAGAHPDMVTSLCLVSPVLDFETDFLVGETPWAQQYFTDAQTRVEADGSIVVGAGKMHIGPAFIDEIKQYSPLTNLDRFYGKVLFVQGDKDEVIDHVEVYNDFVNLDNDSKRIETVTGGNHVFSEEPYTTEAAEIVADFFAEE